MALSATGDFVPFTDVAEAALRGLTGYTVSDEQVAHVMAGFSELPAFPDALPAMTTLTEAGVRVYQASSRCGGWPILVSRSRSGSSDISVSITSKATTAGRCVMI